MKIGIYDDMFFSLQKHLLELGHTVYCYVATNIPEESFNVTGHVTATPRLIHVQDYDEFIHADYDAYIIGTGKDKQNCYEVLKFLYPHKAICGYSEFICQLEYNREFAHHVVDKHIDKKYLKTPLSHSFISKDSAIDFFEDTDKSWVVKQHTNSPLDTYNNRTVVSKAGKHQQVISLIQSDLNAWFDKDGYGGIVVEQYIEGQEVCFGSWFNGTNFIDTYYICEEHKGAQNSDRGRLLTGEVGTWLSWRNNTEGTVSRIFKQLEPVLKGHCCGMIDFNTILTPEGDLYFVEFTIRFGRPTLELMIATGFDFLCVMFDTQYVLAYYAQEHVKYPNVVGTTVFSYGIPLLNDTNALPVMNFDMPVVHKEGNSIQQLFCRHNALEQSWQTTPNERQFVVCSAFDKSSCYVNTLPEHREILKDFDVLGLTWRDDVATNADSILNVLDNLGIA